MKTMTDDAAVLRLWMKRRIRRDHSCQWQLGVTRGLDIVAPPPDAAANERERNSANENVFMIINGNKNKFDKVFRTSHHQ